MKVWISRDKPVSGAVEVYLTNKPVLNKNGYFSPDYNAGADGDDIMNTWSLRDFKHSFGFTPRKGTCKQYELTLKEIK